jgi:pimeloyl-ACP methyl ester carboxylesterase
VAERMIETGGVELCTESFGDPADPPILLIMGMGASMIWWPDDFCHMLADGGRFVVRYDHRDTGRSVTYRPGHPGYTSPDLVGDAAGVLDAYAIPAGHVVGTSMGGAIAQLLALDFPDRVLSLVLMNTSPGGPGDLGLPPVTEEYARFLAEAEVDGSDPEAMFEYVIDDMRALTGGERPFDEAGARELVAREFNRARNAASAQNHALLSGGEPWRARISSIAVPTLVIHGTADPMFELPHGQALAREIPEASLEVLKGAGHVLHRADWDKIVGSIVDHTSGVEARRR